MSYILQALAQSERERRNADSPDLTRVFDVETSTKTGQRRKTLIFGGLLLLVNVIVIAAFMLFGGVQFGDKANTSSSAATDIAPEPAPILENGSALQQETSPARVPPQPINTATSTPVASTPIDKIPSRDITAQHKSLEEQATEYINNNTQKHTPIEELPVVEIPVTEPKPAVDKPAKVETQQAKTQDLSDLERVRTLPGIDMSVHVYSETIAERFVFINGSEYHEGDILTNEGAKLTAITPDGVVVDFGDRRVLLNRVR